MKCFLHTKIQAILFREPEPTGPLLQRQAVNPSYNRGNQPNLPTISTNESIQCHRTALYHLEFRLLSPLPLWVSSNEEWLTFRALIRASAYSVLVQIELYTYPS